VPVESERCARSDGGVFLRVSSLQLPVGSTVPLLADIAVAFLPDANW